MPLKLIMTWNTDQEHEEEYVRFLATRFMPSIGQMGLELSDAYATIYGRCPSVQISILIPDELEAEQTMAKPEWLSLISGLQDHVKDFQMKLVPATDGFQF